MALGNLSGARGKLLELQLNTPTPEEENAKFLAGSAAQIQEKTPTLGGSFIKSFLNTRALQENKKGKAKRTKKEEKQIAHLERMAKLEDYQNQLAINKSEVEFKLGKAKLAEEQFVSNQKSIERAALNAKDFGDVTGLNEVIAGNDAIQFMLNDSLPDGAQFNGVRVVDGEIVAVGKLPDGKTVFGDQTLPLDRFITDDVRSKRLEQKSKELQITKTQQGIDQAQESFPAKQDLLEAKAQEAIANANKADFESKGVLSPKESRDFETNLRKDFQNQSKDFSKVSSAYQRIISSAKDPSPAGDLSMIFNYMKILDPGSVVRESEFATAAKARPLVEGLGLSFDRIKNVWKGNKLSDTQRADFLDRATRLYSSQSDLQLSRENEYSGVIERSGVDKRNVFTGVPRAGELLEISKNKQSGISGGQVGADPMEGKTATNPNTGEKIIYRDGKWNTI